METALNSFSKFSEKTGQSFSILSDQDGLFFGVEFLQKLLEAPGGLESSELTAYQKDGDCIFKGQTLLNIHLRNTNFKKEDLVSAVGYLSGAYTLVSCFTEREFNFSITACPTPGFLFADWERRLIEKARALVQKCPDNVYFYRDEVQQALNRGEQKIVLSALKISKKDLLDILQTMPYNVEVCLQGNFLPADLEEFRDLNLKSVYPLCLQGYFSSLKMRVED